MAELQLSKKITNFGLIKDFLVLANDINFTN